MKEYGIFSVVLKRFTCDVQKEDPQVELQWFFQPGAKEERKFTLDHMSLIKAATGDGGIVRLEVVPMLNGEPLEPVMFPTSLKGKIEVDDTVGIRTCTPLEEFEGSGIRLELLKDCACSLEFKAPLPKEDDQGGLFNNDAAD